MQLINFKDELDLMDLQRMKYHILLILIEYANWCNTKGLDCTISSLKEDVPGRKSTTHRDGRSFDASNKKWGDKKDELANECVEYFNKKYKNMGTAPLGKTPVVCVYHENSGQDHLPKEERKKHLHFQVRRC